MATSVNRPEKLSWMRRLTRRILGFPLFGKVIGANVLIVITALAAELFAFDQRSTAQILILVGTLLLASIASVYLIGLALRPVRELEQLAGRVSGGDFNTRIEISRISDPELAHLTMTVNELLDALAAERKRIQDLGAEVVYAQDAERARVSRELHDSIAQTLAAVRFQVAAAGTNASPEMRESLTTIGGLVTSAMDAVRNVSYTLHPRVAEDLGLEAALTALAAQVRQRSGVDVRVNISINKQVPSNVSTTLFRVAQEALRNIEMHARAKKANVDVLSIGDTIRIEVSDDGQGFDQTVIPAPVGKTGLAAVRDRVTLAGGSMQVNSSPNGGTRVVAEMKTLKAAS